jgi:predicted glutamine amidotransferase
MKSVEIVMYPDGRLDTINASAYVGLSPKTMAMMRCDGTGPRFIKRGRVFYFREDLDAWLAKAERVTSTAQARTQAVAHPRAK